MLRIVMEEDLPIFFAHQRDPDALRMAASVGRDWQAYLAHWQGKMLLDASASLRTVVVGGAVAGYVGSWVRDGRRMVAYWLGQAWWGRGVATAALTEFLTTVDRERPVHAHVATGNVASMRVLEKCGFHTLGPATVGPDGVSEIVFKLEETVT